VLPLLPFLLCIHVGGEQCAGSVDDDGLVRDAAVDGTAVVVVLPRAHLLPSRGPNGAPTFAAAAVPSSRLSPVPSAAVLSMAAAAIAALPQG
jgi:hypothetical protein